MYFTEHELLNAFYKNMYKWAIQNKNSEDRRVSAVNITKTKSGKRFTVSVHCFSEL